MDEYIIGSVCIIMTQYFLCDVIRDQEIIRKRNTMTIFIIFQLDYIERGYQYINSTDVNYWMHKGNISELEDQ